MSFQILIGIRQVLLTLASKLHSKMSGTPNLVTQILGKKVLKEIK